MMFFVKLGQLLLDEWLWNITWGWYHLPINFLLMLILFNLFSHLNIIQSVLISFCAQLYAFCAYSAFIIAILVKLFNFTSDPSLNIAVAHSLNASVYLGIIYALIQTTFLLFIGKRYNLKLIRMILLIFASNLLASLLVYWFLPEIY